MNLHFYSLLTENESEKCGLMAVGMGSSCNVYAIRKVKQKVEKNKDQHQAGLLKSCFM